MWIAAASAQGQGSCGSRGLDSTAAISNTGVIFIDPNNPTLGYTVTGAGFSIPKPIKRTEADALNSDMGVGGFYIPTGEKIRMRTTRDTTKVDKNSYLLPSQRVNMKNFQTWERPSAE